MHMMPGINGGDPITDADGKILNTTTHVVDLTNNVWNFDLKSQKWDVQYSEAKIQPMLPAIAFDAEKQVGWYYGGKYSDSDIAIIPPDLYRLDRGKRTPVKVETNSLTGTVWRGGARVHWRCRRSWHIGTYRRCRPFRPKGQYGGTNQ